jgi:hypothetical protein
MNERISPHSGRKPKLDAGKVGSRIGSRTCATACSTRRSTTVGMPNDAFIKSNRSLDFAQAHLVHALQKRQHDGLCRVPGLSVRQNFVPGIGLEYAGAEIAAGAVPAA